MIVNHFYIVEMYFILGIVLTVTFAFQIHESSFLRVGGSKISIDIYNENFITIFKKTILFRLISNLIYGNSL